MRIMVRIMTIVTTIMIIAAVMGDEDDGDEYY